MFLKSIVKLLNHCIIFHCAAAQYLDVVVNASRQNLITGVVEGHGEHLVGVLEGVDGPLLTDVPQLPQ